MEVKGTLKYRKVQRTPQTGENAGKKKWYATSVTDREVDFEGFVSHISDHGSPYSRGTIHGVLMDALDHLQELILDGKSVRLSDLGLFSIGMSSKAEDTKEKVTAASVDGVHLIVRNTKSWSNAELRKKCKVQEYGGYTGTDEEGGGTTALFVGAGITTVLLNLALLAKLSITPAFRITYNKMYAIHAGSRHLLLGILRLGAHADGEQTEVRETHALAVENQLLQMVECIHQHTVDGTTRVRRAVVGDMRYESLEVHFAVGYRSSIPLLLTCVFTSLRCALYFTIFQCSFYFHDLKFLKG